jgi:phenylalanine-4-hydroxylase
MIVKKDHIVQLDADHPGFRDPEYRQRRDLIAIASEEYDGNPESIPIIKYTDTEQEVWRYVSRELHTLNQKYACEEHLHGLQLLEISQSEIPQLRFITEKTVKYTGFQMAPVAGLVPAKEFLENFYHGLFDSTQYVRHSSQPGFTPEPDIIHDVLGHSGGLCNKTITNIVREIGKAAMIADEAHLRELERIYWFTIEYGLCKEGKQIKTFGAGNLSSFIDIERCIKDTSCHHPFIIEDVIKTPYDPTIPQRNLFIVDSLEECLEQVRDYCAAIK